MTIFYCPIIARSKLSIGRLLIEIIFWEINSGNTRPMRPTANRNG